ncbi:MAG: sigma-54 dependent transcriptional regulator [Candidatus Hydrogenedentota bacterium]
MARKITLLFVEDEEKLLNLLKISFEGKDCEIKIAQKPGEAMKILNEGGIDILVTDLKMPGISGMELLKYAKKIKPEIEVVMMTAYATTQTAVEAMKEGAYDYITKPFKMDEMILLIDRIVEKINLKEENRLLREELSQGDFREIIGSSAGIESVLERIKKVADSPITVLIQGESGTGKELVARAIHKNSQRRNENYVSVNCAAIPRELIESELFGHEKGAFTGAMEMRIGKFELANKGTIFLDEIAELSLELQSKFLRVLQEREIERVGGNKKIKVDVRVIAATNRNLQQLVKEGRFREDLYYRINVFPIIIPPLRERKEDITVLAKYFTNKHAKTIGLQPKKIDNETMDIILSYDWPGNVRELQNAMEHACVLATDEYILQEHLPEYIPRLKTTQTPKKEIEIEIPEQGIKLQDVEKELLIKAVKKARGNLSKAARLLSISRRTLGYRLKKHRLDNLVEEQ